MAVQTDSGGGHDWSAPRFDGLGITYVLVAFFYTVFLAFSLYRLYKLRHTPTVRLRSFPIICFTVIALHFYLLAVLLVYPLNGKFTCGGEFWIMSLVFPMSIALFQASNIRVLSYYEEQQNLADSKASLKKRVRPRMSVYAIIAWCKRLSTVQKTCIGIFIGGSCQFIVTTVLFFGSRRFHSSYGLFSHHVDAGHCRRGVEWLPSVIWQFSWTTVFGPYVLLRIRHIFDSHGWAWQTRLAIIAGLPGTPLWVAFVYSNNPGMSEVNRWFVPPMWFVPGLVTMQLVSIFFPLNTAVRMMRLQKRLDAGESVTVSEKNRTYSLASLDYQIENNIEPLLRWSAQKEFTAENILFLREVRDFKRKWNAVTKRRGTLTPTQLRERYEDAAVIYFTLVNPLTAKFNININHKTYMELQALFSGLRYEPFDDGSDLASFNSQSTGSGKSDNVVTPWADFESDGDAKAILHKASDEAFDDRSVGKLYPMPMTELCSSHDGASTQSRKSVSDGKDEPANITVPAGFTIDCFDNAYDVVRYDVYVNTWSRYEARFSRPQQSRDNSGGVAPVDRSGSKGDVAAMVKRGSKAFGA